MSDALASMTREQLIERLEITLKERDFYIDRLPVYINEISLLREQNENYRRALSVEAANNHGLTAGSLRLMADALEAHGSG